MAMHKADTVLAFLRGVASGDAELATSQVSPDRFVLHDPSAAGGVAGLRELAGRGGSPDVARVIEDRSFVVAHGQDGGEVFFAVFRFDRGRIAEYWRFTAPSAPPNPSGHTQTDGPTHPDASVDSAGAKGLVRDYYETVHIAGKHDQIDRFMAGDRQIRHEPGVCDGVRAFKRDLEMLVQNRTIDKIALLIGQGDFVFIAALGTHRGQPCAYIDLYRVEGDRLVEHWGFQQEIPPRKTVKSSGDLL